MDFYTRLKKIERIDRLIRLEATGRPHSFAVKMDVSESTLYELLKIMKNMGACIHYDKLKETYYYTQPVKFEYGFQPLE